MNFVYYETQPTPIGPLSIKVVDEASASLALPDQKVFPVPLMTNHLTICKPPARHHDIVVRIRNDLAEIAKALLEPQPRPDRFEIDNYEISLEVTPQNMQDLQLGQGRRRRSVRCDNVAFLEESITFTPTNLCQSKFTLRYFTKSDGFVEFTTSHTNEATGEETAEFADHASTLGLPSHRRQATPIASA